MGDLHRLIAFDLDGTLIDSRRDLADSANELIRELGGEPLSEEAIGGMVGDGARLLVRRALTAAGLADSETAMTRFLAFYDQRLLNHTRLYDGVEDVVRRAGEHARIVVLTNKPKAPSERILTGLGVRGLFADVVGGDGPLPRKPDPASLLALMKTAGAGPATTLMVGDSAIDHRTALNAGVRPCLVSFGFGFANFPREQLVGGEWIADSTAALKTFIDDFLALTASR